MSVMSRSFASALRSLVLPVDCCACGVPSDEALCASCATASWGPVPVRLPGRSPPRVAAAGSYAGALRRAVITFKERRHRALAAPLARLLAPLLVQIAGPQVMIHCVPVPATAAARRRRGFDHVAALVAELSRIDPRVVPFPALGAGPRPDSVGLSVGERAAAARRSIRPRPSAGRPPGASSPVVIVDDVVTTGATVTAAAGALGGAGVPVAGAVVLAAVTRRGRVSTANSTFRGS